MIARTKTAERAHKSSQATRFINVLNHAQVTAGKPVSQRSVHYPFLSFWRATLAAKYFSLKRGLNPPRRLSLRSFCPLQLLFNQSGSGPPCFLERIGPYQFYPILINCFTRNTHSSRISFQAHCALWICPIRTQEASYWVALGIHRQAILTIVRWCTFASWLPPF